MEILGIGPGEFILILILLLVVVGPERLPGLARQAGSFLVRVRNWMQTSPDAALVLRARQELEAELASIKTSLMEVQVVRDEVMGAAKQLEDSVGAITSTKIDLNPQIKPPAETTIATDGQALSAGQDLPDGGESVETIGQPATIEQPTAIDLPGPSGPSIQPPVAPQPSNGLANGIAHAESEAQPAGAAPAAPALAELESINVRLQVIMADMWALQQQLKQRGALDQAWQPPSLEVQLPVAETAPLAGPASAAEPIEDAAVLAARKLLEQLTPMQVSYHAPPVVEPAPPQGELASGPAPEAPEAAIVDQPPSAPAPKTRKRRAKASPETSELEVPTLPPPDQSTIGPASSAPTESPLPTEASTSSATGAATVPGRRKRRAPADSATPADEGEPVTTEKAS
ncbi:MAG TPA: twin-arginine translocase TatA/TatE family subunit [Roseiflexaceae bacterium]|nr:twin-arginine translocase TatA/TatE family subunit [Roseiflexaceae bacterium]